MTRIGYQPPALPISLAERKSEYDENFDVIETYEVRSAPDAFPTKPRLVSTAHGPLRRLLLWYGRSSAGQFQYHEIYRDLFRLLPQTTELVIAVHPSVRQDLEALLASERPGPLTTLVETPAWLSFTVWAEDAFVVVEDLDAKPPVTYLLEPNEFPRAGDLVLADLVAQGTDLQASQVPLIFQGGNVLIGDDFVFIGRDYLDESVDRIADQGSVETFPDQGTRVEQEAFVKQLFADTLDATRSFHFLGSTPSERPPDAIVKDEDGAFWIDRVSAGRGSAQPIFHIDMFITLLGQGSDGRYRVLVGDPRLADDRLKWPHVDHDLHGEFDEIANSLAELGFDVHRNPLPYTFAVDRNPREVQTSDGKTVKVEGTRNWYHATTNNCLVQIDGDKHDVWVPTYGHGMPPLAATDDANRVVFEGFDFTVHQLGDFNPFALRLGALHCIKKYLAR